MTQKKIHFMSRTLMGVTLIGLFLSPLTARAESVDYSIEISQKFGRGLRNTLTSPLEIPCTIRNDVKVRGGEGVVTGLFRGIGFFARRLLVGVTEILTFVIPMPETIPPVCAELPEAAIQQ